MSVWDTKMVVGVSDNLKFLIKTLAESLSMGMTVTYVAYSRPALDAAKEEIQLVLKANQLSALYDKIAFVAPTLDGCPGLHTNMLVVDSPSKIAPDIMLELQQIPANILGIGPLYIYAET